MFFSVLSGFSAGFSLSTRFPCFQVISITLALQFLSNSAFSLYCSGTPKKPDYDYQKPLHQQNARLINELYDETSVIGGAGAYYRAGEDKDEFTILHVWGNAYEVGYCKLARKITG